MNLDLDRILDRRWYGNTVREWLIGVVAFLAAALVLTLLRRLLVSRLGRVAERTPNELDDVVVDLVRRTRWYSILAVAFAIGMQFVTLRARVDRVIGHAVVVVIILQLGVWATGVIEFWVSRFRKRRLAEADTASVTTIQAVGYAARAVLWAVVLAMLLHNFGFDISALVTGLGIGGVAIALAVQNVLGDLFAALAIVLDRPFVIGDSIAVDGVAGSVEHIGLKTTRLRSPSGEQIVMGNSELLKGRIHNYKRMIERRVVFTTDVVYGTPPETVARIPTMLREIVLAQSPVRVDRSHFATYTDSALRFETVYYVLVPDYTRFMDIQQTVNLEILRRFTAEGITLAYPTRVVYAHGGPGADGRAPAGPGDASAPGPSPSASPG